MVGEMLSAAKPVTKEAEVEEKYQVMEMIDATEPMVSLGLGSQLLKVTGKVREAIYLIRSSHNVGFSKAFGRAQTYAWGVFVLLCGLAAR